MRRRSESGIGLLELLVSLTITMVALGAIGGLLIQNTRVNKSQQMTAEAQATARIALSMIVQRLRSAGWDPQNAGIAAVNLDSNPLDNVSEIEILADLDQDGLTASPDERVMIRHSGDRILWRRTGNVADPFLVLATNISNDADGNGLPEPMFVPNSIVAPTRITVRITARSPTVDPVRGDFIRYTVSSDVVLRKKL